MLLIVTGVLTVAAAAALLLGWRGPRIDDHPRCRACGYVLVGRQGAEACPECGSDLTAARGIREGRRRRRSGLLVAGSLLAVLSLAGIGLNVALMGRNVPWNLFKPVWLLRIEAGGGDPSRSGAALSELIRRLADGALGDEQIVGLAGDGLVRQADASLSWEPLWGEIIETAWTRGLLSAEKVERYVRVGIESGTSLTSRDEVPAGPDQPVQITLAVVPGRFSDSLLTARSLRLEGRTAAARLPDKGVELPVSSARHTTLMMPGLSTHIPSLLRMDLAEGPCTVELDWDFGVDLNNATVRGRPLRWPGGTPPTWTRTMSTRFTVVEGTVPLVELVDDPELGARIRAGIRCDLAPPPGDPRRRSPKISSGATPVSLAMDVFYRAGGEEKHVATMQQAKGAGAVIFPQPAPVEVFPEAETVDVVFRTNMELARTHTRFESIWNGEVVVEDVPVRWAPFDERPHDAQARAITDSLDVQLIGKRVSASQASLQCSIGALHATADLAFDVFLIGDGRERPLGQVVVRAGRATCRVSPLTVPRGLDTVTLLLRSDPQVAADLRIDVDPWEGEIVLEHVPVR